jgi:hypothetical protein
MRQISFKVSMYDRHRALSLVPGNAESVHGWAVAYGVSWPLPQAANDIVAWRCQCGSFHFRLLPQGAFCASCGDYAWGWADA